MKKNNRKLPFFGIPSIIPYMKPHMRMLVAMMLMGAFCTGVDSVYPLFNRYAINHFLGENTLDTLPAFMILYAVLVIVQSLVNYVDITFCGKMEMYMNRDLRNHAFNHLQELSFSYFNRNNVGYIHSRVMSDTGKIGEMVAWKIMDVIWSGSYLVFTFIMMALLNVRLALIVFVIVPVAVILIGYFQKKLLVLNRRVRESNADITGSINEGITGVMAVKTLGVEKKMEKEFVDETEKFRKLSVKTAHFSSLFAALISLMSAVAFSIVLYRGGSLSSLGIMEIGTLSAFMSYALGMIDPIKNLANAISGMINIETNIERFTELMNTRTEVNDSPAVIEKYGDTFNPKKENWEPLYGNVEFKNVDFKYPDGEEYVLKNFNLKVPKGTCVAIVGETGAGKTTLVNLVCRFFEPTAGSILIDERDARERSQLWLHSNIGYVLQTPHLFSGTVRDNLRYGREDATDEEILKALDLVAASFVIDKLPKGLDSYVGEDGGSLSTGEKQLLSFARAIISDPAILILDEATSSIDTVTEKIIQDAIKKVVKGRTSFVIAHRLSTIVDSDVILVVADGRIAEQGTHGSLIERKGIYYDMYMRQYADRVIDET